MAHLFVWIRSNWPSSTFALQHAAVYGPKLGPKCFLLGCLCSLWPPAYLTRGTIRLCCFRQLLLALVRSRHPDTSIPNFWAYHLTTSPRGMPIAFCFACSYLYPIIFRRELPSVNSYPLAIICHIQLSIDHVYLKIILGLGYRFQIRSSPQQTLLFGVGHYVIFPSLLWLLVGT